MKDGEIVKIFGTHKCKILFIKTPFYSSKHLIDILILHKTHGTTLYNQTKDNRQPQSYNS